MAADRVVIVGGGQAGLAVSRGLTEAGIAHTVLERDRVGATWRGHWDAFTLVTPNWTLNLPGYPYAGDDPQGFVHRDEIVAYLEGYAASFAAPVETGVAVEALELAPGGGFHLRTTAGEVRANRVVLATGAYQKPHRPPYRGEFPKALVVIDAEHYANAAALPPGRVLVIGSGQTGCQIAEDLQLAGREVWLACGRAPWAPRRLDGLDSVDWLCRTNWFQHTLAGLGSPQARLVANVVFTGRDGGHDLNPRVLQAMGVHLAGHFEGVEDGRARFAPDLAESVAFGDERYSLVCKIFREQLPAAGYEVPELPVPEPFVADAPESVDLDGFGTVIFTSGFRPDYARWVNVAGAFDEWGFPIVNEECESVAAAGLYFAGVHFLRTRASSLMFGVGDDAAVVARSLAGEPAPA